MDKISVIVPVYNCEKFLDRCVTCLVNQTYKNIELIFVNDGSKDNSLKVLNKYKKQNKDKIVVIDKENGGVGSARNAGLDKATGDYIVFVDADDFVDKDYLKKLHSGIKNHDIIVSGYRKYNYDYSKVLFERALLDNSEYEKYKMLVIWAKMYKRDFIEKNKIRFNSLKMGEDIVFSLTCISKTDSYTSTSYVGYNNVENFSSATHNETIKKENDLINLVRTIDSLLNIDNPIAKKDYKNVRYTYLKNLSLYIIDKSLVYTYDELVKFYKELVIEIKKILKKNNSRFTFAWQKNEPFKVNAMINLVVLCDKLHLSKLLLKIFSKSKIEYK